jgi:hypothetical protein
LPRQVLFWHVICLQNRIVLYLLKVVKAMPKAKPRTIDLAQANALQQILPCSPVLSSHTAAWNWGQGVTGSSRGIGRAIAERLGRDGANVVVTYAGNRDKAEEVVSVIKTNVALDTPQTQYSKTV